MSLILTFFYWLMHSHSFHPIYVNHSSTNHSHTQSSVRVLMLISDRGAWNILIQRWDISKILRKLKEHLKNNEINWNVCAIHHHSYCSSCYSSFYFKINSSLTIILMWILIILLLRESNDISFSLLIHLQS
jgi:hypothetical protein